MVPTNCHQCGAEVAKDEQFCPNCGAFIDPLTESRPNPSEKVISVSSDGGYEEFALGAAPPEEDPEPERPAAKSAPVRTVACPSCGAANPPNNRHCQECGARLSQAPLPTAPRPAVQASAGVRAAMAISGLLFVVVLVALLFNFLGGGDEDPSGTTIATSETTQPTTEELGPIQIIRTDCTPEDAIVGSFVCDNLVDGTDSEFQVSWLEKPEGESVTIRLTFPTPTTVQQISWTNIADDTRFRQNYRARGLVITANNNPAEFPKELEDVPGQQDFAFAAVNANWIQFEIETAWLPEVVDGNAFDELAIVEIAVIGRQGTVN